MQTFPLTPRLESEVGDFAAALEATPDHVLADLFATPPPKSTKPRHWASQPFDADDLYPE